MPCRQCKPYRHSAAARAGLAEREPIEAGRRLEVMRPEADAPAEKHRNSGNEAIGLQP